VLSLPGKVLRKIAINSKTVSINLRAVYQFYEEWFNNNTFEGPSLIFFIWSLYFDSSWSSRAIFLSTDSPRLSI